MLKIPEGWELDRDAIPKKGEYILTVSGEVIQTQQDGKYIVCHIVRPVAAESEGT